MSGVPHHEVHYINRAGWLRAAVLGANDGIVSTASLMAGIAAAGADGGTLLLSGVASLVAGAMSMAAGEYVSVSAQADTERADIAKERKAIGEQPEEEYRELRDIYVERGLTPDLAAQVARQLMAADALAAHARDELGITDSGAARPVQAALASAASFACGAAPPVLIAALCPHRIVLPAIIAATLLCLALLGLVGAKLGGARPMPSIVRTLFWGALAMAATAGIGGLFGATI